MTIVCASTEQSTSYGWAIVSWRSIPGVSVQRGRFDNSLRALSHGMEEFCRQQSATQEFPGLYAIYGGLRSPEDLLYIGMSTTSIPERLTGEHQAYPGIESYFNTHPNPEKSLFLKVGLGVRTNLKGDDEETLRAIESTEIYFNEPLYNEKSTKELPSDKLAICNVEDSYPLKPYFIHPGLTRSELRQIRSELDADFIWYKQALGMVADIDRRIDPMAPDNEPTDEELARVMQDACKEASQRKAISDARIAEKLREAVASARQNHSAREWGKGTDK